MVKNWHLTFTVQEKNNVKLAGELKFEEISLTTKCSYDSLSKHIKISYNLKVLAKFAKTNSQFLFWKTTFQHITLRILSTKTNQYHNIFSTHTRKQEEKCSNTHTMKSTNTSNQAILPSKLIPKTWKINHKKIGSW